MLLYAATFTYLTLNNIQKILVFPNVCYLAYTSAVSDHDAQYDVTCQDGEVSSPVLDLLNEIPKAKGRYCFHYIVNG